MDERLDQFLAFAVKSKAAELVLVAGQPPRLRFQGEPVLKLINVPSLEAVDIDTMIAPLLTPEARETLKFSGKHEGRHEVAGLGSFGVRISQAEAVFVVPSGPPAGDGKKGFFRKLLGG